MTEYYPTKKMKDKARRRDRKRIKGRNNVAGCEKEARRIIPRKKLKGFEGRINEGFKKFKEEWLNGCKDDKDEEKGNANGDVPDRTGKTGKGG